MGILDSIADQIYDTLSGTAKEAHGGLLSALGDLLNSPKIGGLTGLISAFESKGLGGIIQSWISSEPNRPISAEQLQSVFGAEQLQSMGQKLGLNTKELTTQLAQMLPQVVDKLTPDGVVPEGGWLSGIAKVIREL